MPNPLHTERAGPKPTVVLVHGAFADVSSWAGVTRGLQKDGFPVIAALIPHQPGSRWLTHSERPAPSNVLS
jgi:hypothetical protein